MKFSKATALLAIATLGMSASPAMAYSFSGASSNVTINGYVTAGAPGKTYDCQIWMVFRNHSTSLERDIATLPNTTWGGGMGSSPCNELDDTFYYLRLVPVSTTQVKADTIDLGAPFGMCKRNNVFLSWANGPSASRIYTISNIAIGICTLNSLSMSFDGVQII